MNQENYNRLNDLAFAREHRRPMNADTPTLRVDNDARRALWIAASVILTDDQAEFMIAQLERGIVDDAIYYANKIEEKA